MIYGTAGYTAGLAIEQLEKSGMSIEGKSACTRCHWRRRNDFITHVK